MKLSSLILKAIFITTFTATLLAFIINTLFEYTNFKNEIREIKKVFIKQKKDELKRELEKAFNYINFHEKNIEQKVKETLRTRVTDAYTIAYQIYNTNKNIKSENEIKYLIIAALQNISYEHKDYFFINSNDGEVILSEKKSFHNTHKNIWDFQDIKGNYTVREQSEVALVKKEGFIKSYLKNPTINNETADEKLSFVKLFEPYNWHIGMGEYLDEIIDDSKNEILEYIASLRFSDKGYIFVNTLDKKALVFDGKKTTPPKTYPNDILFEQQLNAIKNKDGDFFFYKFKKLNTIEEYPKMAFVKLYDKWNWIIGTGVYIDELDNELAKKESQLKSIIITQTTTTIFIFLVLLALIFFISKKITSYVEQNILNLIHLFKEASFKQKEINIEKFTFKEFKTIARNLNKTLRQRNKAEKKIHSLMDIINKNVIISSTNTKGIIIDANDFFCDISGYSREELIGKSHNIIRHPDMPKKLYEEMWATITKGEIWEGEIKNLKKNGEIYWVKTTIYPTYNKNTIIGYTAIRQDITDRKKVEHLSITDDLTQTYNRRHFNVKINEEINRAKRNDYYLGFLMLDIDYFKLYNDTYGHQLGDITLQKVANILKNNTNRATDFTFRLGGEEFGIIFSFKDEKESLAYANLIKEEIENLKIEHKTSKVIPFITASIGLVVRKGENIDNDHTIYKLADEALYNAKGSGRNKVFVSA